MELGLEKVPVYALAYVVDGDPTGLSKRQVKKIDRLLLSQDVELVLPLMGGDDWLPYYSSTPWFGRPCEVVDCEVVYRVRRV